MATALKGWNEYLDALKGAGALAERTWRPEDEQYRADLYQQLMMNISYAYFVYFQSDEASPDFMPLWNSVYVLQPNPDDVYLWAPLQGDLSYRIVGHRGTTHLVSFLLGEQMIGLSDTPQPGSDYFEIDDLQVAADGSFELIISPERLAGYTGNWHPLKPNIDHIMVRQRSYDWGNEIDCRFAIECLDGPDSKRRLSVEDVAARLEKLVRLPERWSGMWIDWQNDLLKNLGANKFEHNTTFSAMSAVPHQVYWQAIFELEPGEALILETDLPAKRPYWNVQMNDGLFNAVDFVTRQASLNGHQAQVDSDGRFRAVIANEDPGVPNWLDPGGNWQGTIMGRWLGCDSSPLPGLKRVPLAEVRQHLPADTPAVSPAQRRESLRRRALGAKLRRRW